MPELLRWPCKITNIAERFVQDYVSGFGDTATFTSRSIGWWITLDGRMSLPCGPTRPSDFNTGDHVRLTLDKP